MATAPGLTQWVPLPYGSFREALRDPLGFQWRARERLGDVFRFRIGPMAVHGRQLGQHRGTRPMAASFPCPQRKT